MNKVKQSLLFAKDVKHLKKKYPSILQDIAALRQKLQSDIEVAGEDLGAGFRKIRMAISSKKAGKRGGARVITLDIIFQEPDADGDLKEIILFSITINQKWAALQ